MIKYNHIINNKFGITISANMSWQRLFNFISNDDNNYRKAVPYGEIDGEKYWNCSKCNKLVNKSEINFWEISYSDSIFEFKIDNENELQKILDELFEVLDSPFEKNIDHITNNCISKIQSIDYYKNTVRDIAVNISEIIYDYTNKISNISNKINNKVHHINKFLYSLFLGLNSNEIEKFYKDYKIIYSATHQYKKLQEYPDTFLIGNILSKKEINFSNENIYNKNINLIIDEIQSTSNKLKKLYNENKKIFSQIYEYYNKIKNKPLHKYYKSKTLQPICNICYNDTAYFCNHPDCEYSSLYDTDLLEIKNYDVNQKSKQTNFDFFQPNNYQSQYYCEDHAFECNSCENVYKIDELNITRNYESYCKDCYDEIIFSCSICGDEAYYSSAYYDEDNYNYTPFCSESCAEKSRSDNKLSNDEIKYFQPSGIGKFYPIDQSTINLSVIPALELAKTKLKPNSSIQDYINFAVKRIQKQEAKNAVLTKGKYVNTIDEIIEFFKSQSQEYNRVKTEYPNLKGIKFLPVRIEIEETPGHNGTAFVIYPTEELLDYAEIIAPGAKNVYKNFLAYQGHHEGALGYARVSRSGDDIIIDNLQTDLDRQSLANYNGEYKNTPGLNWWLTTIKNFWSIYLLDALKQFGKNINKRIYLTDFDTQKRKWNRIPERNRDIYDRLPKLMNMEKESVYAKPEGLYEDNYLMSRVASNLLNLSNLYLKLSKQYEKNNKHEFWITNISDKNVTLGALGMSFPARKSINLLDDKHFTFTLEQLEESAKSGSLFDKRDMFF